MSGWVKLHRKLLEHPRCSDPDWVAVWVYLLLNATHAPIRKMFNGRETMLRPGQLICGRYVIAEKTGVHASKVQRVLSMLKTDQQINQQGGNKSSIITIRNWALYQGTDQQTDQQTINSRSANDQQSITLQEVEEVEEQEEGEKPLPPEVIFWNANRGQLAEVLAMNSKRATALRARRVDDFWRTNFEPAVLKLAALRFCQGANDRGWKATFDWMLRPDTVAKIIEGHYDENRATPTQSRSVDRPNPRNAGFASTLTASDQGRAIAERIARMQGGTNAPV
jgi:hypothetical protein